MRILIKQVVCVGLILCLSGCWNSREMDTLGIVLGVGIDVSEGNSDEVKLIAQIVKPEQIGSSKGGGGGTSGGSGGGSDTFWNVASTGETIFSAVREMTSKVSRKLFFPHNDVIVIGRNAAEGGIQKYLDYFERDHETRTKVTIIISETTAEDVLGAEPGLEKTPATRLSALIKQYAKATSQVRMVKLKQFIDSYMSQTTSAVAPIVKVVEYEDEKIAEITGTAVFKGDKMVGILDKTEGRGLLWVLGEIQSGIIEVSDSAGYLVSAEIIRARVKVTPVLEDGKITMKIEIKEEGNIGEQAGPTDLTDLSEIMFLETEINKAIQNEVTLAVKKAQSFDADIFGFGDMVKAKYPKEWENMKETWDELFKTLKIELTVDAKLRLMGKISRPLVPVEG